MGTLNLLTQLPLNLLTQLPLKGLPLMSRKRTKMATMMLVDFPLVLSQRLVYLLDLWPWELSCSFLHLLLKRLDPSTKNKRGINSTKHRAALSTSGALCNVTITF